MILFLSWLIFSILFLSFAIVGKLFILSIKAIWYIFSSLFVIGFIIAIATSSILFFIPCAIIGFITIILTLTKKEK